VHGETEKEALANAQKDFANAYRDGVVSVEALKAAGLRHARPGLEHSPSFPIN
jgi:hypothetical protein